MSSSPNDATRVAERNALRRVEWRFLAGRARFARAVCDSRPDLAAAAAAMCDEIVGPESGVASSLAVLSDPTPAVLQRVYAQLEAGGICYVEWNRPGSMRSLRDMHRVGFVVHERYAMWPPPRWGSPLFWLPLSQPLAVDYFLRNRPLPRDRKGRIVARITRRAWRLARRLDLLAPVAMLAYKPNDTGEPPPLLSSLLRAAWTRWELGGTPSSIGCVMLTGGRSDLNKIVVLAFGGDEPVPRLAVKLARTAASEEGLRREAAVLRAVSHTAVPDVADVPRFVFAERLAGTLAIGETVVDGYPLQLDLTRDTFRELVTRVTDVLSALAPPSEPAPVTSWRPRLVSPVLAAFRERFGALVDTRRIDAVEQALWKLPPLPLVPEQRDCSPWNVLISPSGRLALLDWESAEPSGLPALDLLYFLAHAAFIADGTLGSGHESTTYRALQDERTPFGRVFVEMVARYAAGVGIDVAAVRSLQPFMWMVHAVGEYDRAFSAISETDPDRARTAARRSLFLALWQQNVKDASVI